MRLNLGCGKDWREFTDMDGVDIVDFGQKFVLDLEIVGLEPIKDSSVDYIRAFNILEHIRIDKVIFVMNECHRVLCEGGLFDIKVPKFPHSNAVADPTHKSYWVVETFKDYFAGSSPRNADYGIKKWAIANDGNGNYILDEDDRSIHIVLRR